MLSLYHIMLDLETFGNKPGSAIVSIGAVQFDINTGKLGKEFYVNVNPSSSLYYGGTVDGSTLMWWMDQSDESRKALMKGQVPLKLALEKFTEFYKSCGKGIRVWGNGSVFDNVILSSAYNATMMRKPWPYNADCDMRTIVAVGGGILGVKITDYKRVGIHHNALDDAKFQAMVVSDIYMKLNGSIKEA